MNHLAILQMFRESLIKDNSDQFMSIWEDELKESIDYSISCVSEYEELRKNIEYLHNTFISHENS